MSKKFSVCITNAPVAEYRPTTYLSEEFNSIEEAEARFEELAKNLKNDWPRGSELCLAAYDGGWNWSTVKDVKNF